MIHNSTIKKVLLLGSGALQIGQAGEFDYSGSQAIKAMREDNIEVILINPNIATIQTSKDFADRVYFTPIQPHFVEEVIKKEKPDGILLSFGGQTALNCGLTLVGSGVLKKYQVQVLGTPIAAIEKTEDRHFFAKMLSEINLNIPKSQAAKTVAQAIKAANTIGYPVIARGAFSLGGQDSGVAYNQKELLAIVEPLLAKTSQVLIEEYLVAWKEIEYEVVRDSFDNTITVCNMENVDPMGIHTGESIVVAPSQTLNNFEYHTLRSIAIKVIRHLGIVGECNIQFALNPNPNLGKGNRVANQKHDEVSLKTNSKTKKILGADGGLSETEIANRSKKRGGRAFFGGNEIDQQLDYRIIEVNARLSRSSALASKATGYPLAYVATKLALGYSLVDLKNSVTGKTIACFEPALDYLVVKVPRWDLGKFVKSGSQIGSSMQSVGEVMAIGRKFEEAIQKATRMLDIGLDGICDEKAPKINYKIPTPWRIFAIARALGQKVPIEKIAGVTGIDPFFLYKIKNIADFEKTLTATKNLPPHLLLAKKLGFSDKRIATVTGTTEDTIRGKREKLNIHPHVKQIDTLAAEYPAQTNYLYLTYNGDGDDIDSAPGRSGKDKIIVLGSGPYRIGSSVEFDWCCVTCAQTVQKNGLAPIIVNCNPETVSTDYDMAQKLYFEELTTETILEIYRKEKPQGVIVSMGGQTPNNLVLPLDKFGVKILGTTPTSIDRAEDRHKFSLLCDQLAIDQPPWAKLKNIEDAILFAEKIGYPVLVRPSYVLSGAAMNVAFNSLDLKKYLSLASHISSLYPVVISKFIENAKEIEIDAVAKNGRVLTFAICEHVENAGVHSGDSTMVLPPQKIYRETEKQIEKIAALIAKSLKITGPFNIQFLARNNKVMVIECNLRASRSLPFVSKVTGINFVQVATEAILDSDPPSIGSAVNGISYVGVKAPQFSFSRIKGADPVLRVEMTSTGEVACFGRDVHEAFLKSLIATGLKLPKKSVFISLAGEQNKIKFLESTKILATLGLKIYATAGTSQFLKENGVRAIKLYKIHEHKKPNVLDYLTTKKIDLVINIIDPYFKKEFDDDYLIRRTTIDYGVPLLTNLQTAELFVTSFSLKKLTDLKTLPWDYYLKLEKTLSRTYNN